MLASQKDPGRWVLVLPPNEESEFQINYTGRKWQGQNLKRSIGACQLTLLTGFRKAERECWSSVAGVTKRELEFCFVNLNSVKGKE